ncbi:bis(5'-nucleosyl)-tetraphosphatase (symmetrical) YqeK [Sporosarcina sp. ACRSM]|uniref:bis(5'-nucleosyl)-tetraphosphatase (symmetrical) YqeK n=1 Tax=Sporosarcina sp. ACRSM TaxID=2918216 RepID=UPI001EF746B8|nr:bis(5'-nucleosyl)-tetraphosphatase (symmetrical) YqeK [Sporosarcina sp. ACRSM]MCG7336443.1 bis(5'-nucleosyl)-tetraphosphatase (symmetrical) YqeK [Sporosarcina sp. ACRSM]
MDVEQLKKVLQQRLTQSRYEHVLRVAETAKAMAVRYDISVLKAGQAALFHDIAKCMSKTDLRDILEREQEDPRLLDFHHELWHGPVGAVIAQQEFNVADPDVVHAIRYHTTGRAGMSDLEKLIYVADMIEPGRDFPGVETLRELANENLHAAMGACIYQSVKYLVNKKVSVYPDSIDCYNIYID